MADKHDGDRPTFRFNEVGVGQLEERGNGYDVQQGVELEREHLGVA